MSWCLAGHLAHRGGKCLQIIGPVNLRYCSGLQRRRLSTCPTVCSDNHRKEEISHTTILTQNGSNIQELPVIVRKAKITSVLWGDDPIPVNKPDISDELCSDSEEINSFMDGLRQCRNLNSLFDFVMHSAPREDNRAPFAVEALRRLIELENNQHYRRRAPQNNGSSDEDKSKHFQRDAIVSCLLEQIIPSQDPKLILESLKIITRDMTRAASRQNNTWVGQYRLRLSQEALIFATDCKFSILQLCEVVQAFSYLDKSDTEQIDMLWVGFEAKSSEIDERNIVEVFRALPHLKKSRFLILSLAETAFMQCCWDLSGAAIGEIMTLLQVCAEEGRIPSQRLMAELSHWVATNISSLEEAELDDIVTAFHGMGYCSPHIVQSIEQYLQTHDKSSALLASIMEFCSHFRIRSPAVLECCANHLANHAHNLSPSVLKSMFVPFGILHYHPENCHLMLKAVNDSLIESFVRFRPEDALEVILSELCLGYHPVPFVNKIFNSHFLDRLESTQNIDVIRGAHSKLKVFDIAMTLECADYLGPLLPRDANVKSMWIDARLRRIVSLIASPLEKLIDGKLKVSNFVLLPEVPAISMYVLDILLHPEQTSTHESGRLSLTEEERKSCIAFLVHIPEHYCAQMNHLIGPQIMRHRHFKKLGIKCVKLRYDILAKARLDAKTLEEYLLKCLKCAKKETSIHGELKPQL